VKVLFFTRNVRRMFGKLLSGVGVRISMQDYESLGAAVVILTAVVNRTKYCAKLNGMDSLILC